jgi:hypothetical protein
VVAAAALRTQQVAHLRLDIIFPATFGAPGQEGNGLGRRRPPPTAESPVLKILKIHVSDLYSVFQYSMYILLFSIYTYDLLS